MISEALPVRASFLDVWTRWRCKAVRSLRSRGVAGTVRHAVALAKHDLSLRWVRYLDRVFDLRFGVDTAGVLVLPELQSDPRFKYSSHYEPTPRSLFFRMLRQLDVDYSNFVFIDFGCGKGRVLLLAAELPFKQIVGIELSSKLFRVAENNLKSYLGPRRYNAVQIVCMDASEYGIPEERAIYYFYNPFTAETMRKVLENIRRSLAATPRETYVVYFNDVLKSLLDESGFLTPIKQTSLYSIYKASGL